MASTKEIKGRIKSVRDTQKITNAMYLIASTKLRKARQELSNTRPFFEQLSLEMKRLFVLDRKAYRKYLASQSNENRAAKPSACLVITADKGLAGAYNQNVIKEAEKLLSGLSEYKLFVVGEYGRQYFTTHNIPIEKSFLYTAQNPTIRRAREISELLVDMYDEGLLENVFIVYTDMQSSLSEVAVCEKLLPLKYQSGEGTTDLPDEKESYDFVPDVAQVIDNCVRSHLSGFIYSALVDSFCSEQNARMNAMSAANDNADELLGRLTVEYNRVRQAAITREITEVCAGAKAQKKKRKKEACKVC